MALTPSQIEMLFKKTLRGLEDGTPLRQLLGQAGYPSRRKFYDWIRDDEKMRERYARAKDLHLENLFEELEEIARTPLVGETSEHSNNGFKITQGDNVARSRLMVDVIKWRLAKERPTVYGDKIDVTSGGQALAVPAIVGMVIQNETTPPNEPAAEDDLF